MKVLHVCYSDNLGGAFIGAHRLHSCMRDAGIDSKLLVIKKRTDDPYVIRSPFLIRLVHYINDAITKRFLRRSSSAGNEVRSFNIFPSFLHIVINAIDADIVQFHWMGSNTISIRELKKIRKPMVWKLPDMWAFCATEHYSNDERYITGYLNNNGEINRRQFDIDRYCWKLKQKHWSSLELKIICPSKWLEKCAKKSMLLKNYPIHNIPNPINTNVFSPDAGTNSDNKACQIPTEKRIILFVSMVCKNYERKGFRFFDECMADFSRNLKHRENYVVVVMGPTEITSPFHGFTVINLGLQSGMKNVAKVYALSDVTVFSSVNDNLPNVIKESMSCGTPCVAFDVGGVPDMITHLKNGYLATPGDHSELSKGLKWIFEQNQSELSAQARQAALDKHGHKRIVEKYVDVYASMISQHKP